jgi:hypothetical protein
MYKHTEEAWLTWSEINQIQKRRKLVFFGRGEWMEKSLPYLVEPAAFVVDNNRYEQGQVEAGLNIYSPERLKTEDPESIFVIITTNSFPDVDQQLRSYGFAPGIHYCVSPSLKNFQVTSRVHGHRQIVHFTCSDQPDRGGGLYSYDLATREKTLLLRGHCHGIAQSGSQIALVDDLVGVRIMNPDLQTVKIIDMPGKSRPHGIAICPQRNWLFVNFSGRDAIGIYDIESGAFMGEIPLSEKFQKTGVAQHHINDCCVYGDYLYVSMFSASGNWKIGMYDGCIMQFDIDSRNCLGPVANDLWMPHTPIVINGVLHYCDSMRGIVSDTTWRAMTQFSGFVRGITYDGVYYYIGQSAHRYIDRRAETTNNISLDTGIFLVDAVNKVTKFFSIPDLTDINSVIFVRKA